MQPNEQERCEACGQSMVHWSLSPNCILLKCPKCSHIKRDINLCGTQVREQAWGGNEFFDRIRCSLTMKRLEKLIPKDKQLNILELGFGSGKMLEEFLKKGHKVYGIEAEHLGIDIANTLKKYGTLYFDRVENVQLPTEEFDLIYGIHLIEHLDNPTEVFKKCYNSLKQDGVLYFITPNADSKGLTIFKNKWWHLEDPTHIRFFSPRSISIMLNKAGFGKIKTSSPLLDSLTLEINSFLRFFMQDPKKGGVLSNKYTKLLDAGMLPLAILVRILYPAILPSIEVMAWKST